MSQNLKPPEVEASFIPSIRRWEKTVQPSSQWLQDIWKIAAGFILFSIHVILVTCLGRYAPWYLQVYIWVLDWSFVPFCCLIFGLYLVFCSVWPAVFLNECIKHIRSVTKTASVKSFEYLTAKAALLHGLGKQHFKYMIRKTIQIIVFWCGVAMPLIVYSLHVVSPSSFRRYFRSKHILMTFPGAQNIYQCTPKWDIEC